MLKLQHQINTSQISYVNRPRCKLDSGKIPVIPYARSKHVFKANIQKYTLKSMFRSFQMSTAKMLMSQQ